MDENSQNFMNNYMSCRKQSTVVNGSCSVQEKISYGMAQGSILGPLIFILYVNDIFKSLDNETSIHMYADNTLLMCKADDINMVTEKSQNVFSFKNLVRRKQAHH